MMERCLRNRTRMAVGDPVDLCSQNVTTTWIRLLTVLMSVQELSVVNHLFEWTSEPGERRNIHRFHPLEPCVATSMCSKVC